MKTPLTRGDRARTVLLLRCAADNAISGNYIIGPSWVTAPRLGLGRRECKLANRFVRRMAKALGKNPDKAQDADEYAAVLLGAAILVEEGAWS